MLVYCEDCEKNIGRIDDEKIPANTQIATKCPQCGNRIILSRPGENQEQIEPVSSEIVTQEDGIWDPVGEIIEPSLAYITMADTGNRLRILFRVLHIFAVLYLVGEIVYLIRNPHYLSDIVSHGVLGFGELA
ncbi:hypothetical protein ACFL6N_07010, partial [Thermodesulfobacteriota bacterium]